MGIQPNPPIGWNAPSLDANSAQALQLGHGLMPGLETPKEDDKFNPLKLFWFVIHYRWIVVACVLAGILSGVMYTWLQTPMYRSTAKLEIAKSSAKVLQDIEVTSEINDLLTFETARLKLLSRDLARRVVFELNLGENNNFLAPTPEFSLFNLFRKTAGESSLDQLADLTPEDRESRAISLVQAGLRANLVRNTSILSVSYSHPVAAYTSEVVNQVMKSYMDQNVDAKAQTSDLARQFIREQVVETKILLEKSEKALVDYAEEAGLTVTADNASLVAGNLTGINKLLSIAVNDRLIAERHVAQLKRDGAASLPQVFESKTVQAAKAKLIDLQSTYQQKLATLRPGFPEMRKLRAQIREIRRNMKAEIASIGKSVKILHQQANAKENAMRAELARLEGLQREYQRKNIRYTILKREADSNRAQYENLTKKLGEVGVGAELKNAGAAIVDEGRTPFGAYSPNLSFNILTALALFSAFGAGLIYLLELLNNTFSVPDQIESELQIPILGMVPRLTKKEFDEVSNNPKSAFSEAYRTLRTSVQFTGTEDAIKHLLVTSAEPNEGKTTTAARLATDFAALGKNVLIIDADLRKPRLHRIFGVDNAVGLSNMLSNVVLGGDVKSCFKPTKHPNLTVLTTGTIPPNPADLLASPRMGLILQFLTKQYDIIILDSPPILGLSDAPILSRMADATLMVIACKQTKRVPVKTALGRLKSAGGNVVGAAFTKFKVDRLDYNYTYRYMQDNYYSYGEAAPRLAGDGHIAKNADTQSGQNAGVVGNLRAGVRRRVSQCRELLAAA